MVTPTLPPVSVISSLALQISVGLAILAQLRCQPTIVPDIRCNPVADTETVSDLPPAHAHPFLKALQSPLCPLF